MENWLGTRVTNERPDSKPSGKYLLIIEMKTRIEPIDAEDFFDKMFT